MSAVATAAPFTCAIDQSPHETLEALHKHLRTLKVTQETYYTAHAPRRDRATGEPIPFKAPAAEYLKREFLNKQTLQQWFVLDPEAARPWALQWLANRKAEKSLVCAPCQVELRSLLCPSRHYYETRAGGYQSVTAELGYEWPWGGTLPATFPPLACSVVVDTREQQPLKLRTKTVSEKLHYGDYGLAGEHDRGVYIERKSINDLIGTLSDRAISRQTGDDSAFQRFTRELERAEEAGAYVVMLVEHNLDEALAFKTHPKIARDFTHLKVTPEAVFHNLRELFHRFPRSFQALFVENRTEAAAAVVKLLAAGDVVRTVDLQYAHDVGDLILN